MSGKSAKTSTRSGSDSEVESLPESEDYLSVDSDRTNQDLAKAEQGSDDSSDDERSGRNTG